MIALRYILALLLIGVSFLGLSQDNYERIYKFHSDIEILKNRDVIVTETIEINALGYEFKRGIYREIPLRYKVKGGSLNIAFDILSIERDGAPENYHTEWETNGIVIYVGEKDSYIEHGRHTYVVKYKISDVLLFYDDMDELFWNVNGHGWSFSIDTLSATVHLPKGAGLVASKGYTGYYGDTLSNYTSVINNSSVYFIHSNDVGSHESMSVAVSWEKGFIDYPTRFEQVISVLRIYAIMVIIILGILLGITYNFVMWWKYGRDPKPGTIIPRFHAPEGMSPAECLYFQRSGHHSKNSFGAMLLSLAVKRAVKIEVSSKSKYETYFVHKESEPNLDKLSIIEEKLFSRLLSGRQTFTIKENKYNSALVSAKEHLESDIEKTYGESYFKRNRHLKWRQFVFPLLTAGLAFLAYLSFGGSVFIIVAGVIVHLIMNFIFAHLFEQPTKKARAIMDEIAGFEMYIRYADLEQIKALNPPTMDFHHFEENLPYAMAFGLADQWAGKFDPAELKEFESGHMPYLYGMHFHSLNRLGSTMSKTISAAATPPSSSGGGSGGYSGGGGFSGGGFGGGGGGGW